jgi:hypothetical protein
MQRSSSDVGLGHSYPGTLSLVLLPLRWVQVPFSLQTSPLYSSEKYALDPHRQRGGGALSHVFTLSQSCLPHFMNEKPLPDFYLSGPQGKSG